MSASYDINIISSDPLYGMSAVNCTTYPYLQPNPDVSGIGVLLSFIVTAYLTYGCCVAKCILDHQRKKATPKRARSIARWSSALESAILSFSDQQLVTGISTIIGGLSQLGWGITVYHFQTVGNLAWFSTVTHILTLTVLRGKMQSPASSVMRTVRIVLMGCLVVLLSCVMAPSGYTSSAYGFSGYQIEPGADVQGPIPIEFPAWCLYHPSVVWGDENGRPIMHAGPFGYNITYVVLTLGVIIYGYVSRVLLIFPGFFSHSLLQIPSGQPWIWFESQLARLRTICVTRERSARTRVEKFLGRTASLAHFLCLSVYVIMVSCKHVFSSASWELTWLFAALMWGTVRLVLNDVQASREVVDNVGSNNHFNVLAVSQQGTFGFGQVVVLVLLGIPVVSFFDAYFSSTGERQSLNPASSASAASVASSASAFSDTELQKDLSTKRWYRCLKTLWHLMFLMITIWGIWDVGISAGASLSPVDQFTAGIRGTFSPGSSSSIFRQLAAVVLVTIGMLWAFVLMMLPEWPILSHKLTVIALTFLWFALSGTFIVYGVMIYRLFDASYSVADS